MIDAPPPFTDGEIVSADTFADEDKLHAIFTWLRAHDPLHWTAPEGYRPFWSVTRHADILEISRQNDQFLSDPRTTLATIEAEDWVREVTGGNHQLVRTLVHMDNPDHHAYRLLTQAWFMPQNLKRLEADVAGLAREAVDGMAARGPDLDFVADVAVWYPLRVIMMILGVPREDEPLMLKLTQEIFGPEDPEMQRPGEVGDLHRVVADFFAYFNAITADRRANPRDDLASLIANAEIGGKPIGEFEAMSYYTIVATAGHDTTSSSVAGGLLALLENPDELARLKADPALIPSAVEEMIRWVTPVKHFMRTATSDYPLRGKTIKAGDSLCLFYPSANRDEEVYEEPFAFRVDRAPNRHLAFGFGAHLCLGLHLARMEMAALFRELLPRLEHVELAGAPARVRSSFVSGLKHLPIRCRVKPAA